MRKHNYSERKSASPPAAAIQSHARKGVENNSVFLLVFPYGLAPIPAFPQGKECGTSFTFKPYGLAGSVGSVCSLSGLFHLPLLFTPLIYPSPKSKISTLPQGEGCCSFGVCKAPSLMREGWGGC